MAAKRKGLGRGLDALLGPQAAGAAAVASAASGKTAAIPEVPIEKLKPGRYQPRQSFGEAAISELAASIKAQGIMQPIVVRSLAEGRYEIIAGERRWRAAQEAGLAKVPVIVRKVADKDALVLSLIENLQREDLNPIEEARALHRLIADFEFTHQAAADAVGKSRSAVTNLLRLDQLSEAVKEMLVNGELEMGHARALLTLGPSQQLAIARKIAQQGLSVRQTEDLVRRATQPRKPAASRDADPDTRRLESRLADHLGQPVHVAHTKSGKGRLTITYATLAELDNLLDRLGYTDD